MNGDLTPERAPSQKLSMRAVGKWTGILAVGVLLGQVFGVGRTLFVATEIGASPSFDAVLVALVFPTIVANWLSNGVRVAIVPAYAQVVRDSGVYEARRFVGAVLTYLAFVSIVALIALVILADIAVAVAGPGLSPSAHLLAVANIPLVAPMVAFLAASSLLAAVCQANRQFSPIAFGTAIGSFAGLVSTVALWQTYGVTAYALGVAIEAGVTLIVVAVAALRRGILPIPSITAERRQLAAFARLVLPLTFSDAVLQLNLISDRAVATTLTIGAASALKYGQQVVSAPIAALSTSWSTVIYPVVVGAGTPGSTTRMAAAMTTALRYTIAMFVPIAVATVAFAPLVVNILYGRGAFNAESTTMTTLVVAAFAPMLVLKMIQPVFTAAHNARRRGTLMAVTGIANAILNLVLNVVLGRLFGVAGIALSTSLTVGILLIWLAWRVPPTEGFNAWDLISVTLRSFAASLVPGVPIALYLWLMTSRGDTQGDILALFVLMSLGATGYWLMARWLRIQETQTVLHGMLTAAASRMPWGSRDNHGTGRP